MQSKTGAASRGSLLLPLVAAFVAHTIWGFSYAFSKNLLEITTTFQLIGLRFLIALVVMVLLVALGVIKINLPWKRFKRLFQVAFFQPVAYFILEVWGLYFGTSSEGGIFLALVPVFTVLLSALFCREYIKPGQGLFVLVSISGVLFIALMDGVFMGLSVSGQLFFLLAALSASFYNIASNRLKDDFTPVEITFGMMVIAGVIFNLIGMGESFYLDRSFMDYLAPLFQWHSLVSLLTLGVLCSVVAFFLCNYCLNRLRPYQVAVFTNYTPIVAVLVGVFVMQEAFYWYHLAGFVLILLGVWGTNHTWKTNVDKQCVK